MNENPGQWDQMFSQAEFAYNDSPNRNCKRATTSISREQA
jgi:hypothetical protein